MADIKNSTVVYGSRKKFSNFDSSFTDYYEAFEDKIALTDSMSEYCFFALCLSS